jgi:hypothetical protein
LGRLGVGKGDVVATLICRVPFLYVAAMRTMKRGSVYTPLFSAFGPDPIVVRLTKARAGARDDGCAVSPQGRTAARAIADLEHVLIGPDVTGRLFPVRPSRLRSSQRRPGDGNHRPGATLSAGSQTVLPTVGFSPATTVEFSRR